LLGWLIDHYPRIQAYVLVASLMCFGSVGYALLATAQHSTFVVGAGVAFGAGWAWTGVFEFGVVRDHRMSAARASGSAQTGLLIGAAAGPMLFGLIAADQTRSMAWAAMGILSLVGGLLVLLASCLVKRAHV
jgi:MFS family permease